MIDIKLADHSTSYDIYYIPDAKSKLEEYLSKLIDHIIENYEKLEDSDFLDWLYEFLELDSPSSLKKHLQENKDSIVDMLYDRITTEALDLSVNKGAKISINGKVVKDDFDIFLTTDFILYYLHNEFGDIFPITHVLGFEDY